MSTATSQRQILHLYFPDYLLHLHLRKKPALTSYPLCVYNAGDRPMVIARCRRAAHLGIRPGSPLKYALKIYPKLKALREDRDLYARCTERIAQFIAPKIPLYEIAALDSLYVDLSGMERFFGVKKTAIEIGTFIQKQTQLPLHMGLASNKLLAFLASRRGGNEPLHEITEADKLSYLRPLSVRELPGVGPETARQLEQLGISTLEALQDIPKMVLNQTFGKLGTQLYHKARGEDDSPIHAPQTEPALHGETRFSQACDNPDKLEQVMVQQIEQLGFRLRKKELLSASVGLKLAYNDGKQAQRSMRIPFCASDRELLTHAQKLLDMLYDRRMRIKRMVLSLGNLIPGQPQLQLFSSQASQIELYEALDSLRDKYGMDAIRRASGM